MAVKWGIKKHWERKVKGLRLTFTDLHISNPGWFYSFHSRCPPQRANLWGVPAPLLARSRHSPWGDRKWRKGHRGEDMPWRKNSRVLFKKYLGSHWRTVPVKSRCCMLKYYSIWFSLWIYCILSKTLNPLSLLATNELEDVCRYPPWFQSINLQSASLASRSH